MEINMTKTEKLLNAFKKGANLTSKQISARFGLKNPTAAIHALRSEGHTIRFNQHTTKASYFNMSKPTAKVAGQKG